MPAASTAANVKHSLASFHLSVLHDIIPKINTELYSCHQLMGSVVKWYF